MATAPRKTWQQDPQRRTIIVRATLETIALHGVDGTTYRKIAQCAAIPLGSVTYYFPSMQALLLEAFSTLAHDAFTAFAATLNRAQDKMQARQAIVEIIFGEVTAGDKTNQLSYELYSYACRTPVMKQVMKNWMNQSRASLERHFSPLAAVALDALIEGMILHRSVIPVAQEDVYRMVAQLSEL